MEAGKREEKKAETKRKADEKLKNTTHNTSRKRSAASARAASKYKKSKSIEQSTDTDQPCTSSMSGRIADSPTSTEERHVKGEKDAICCECNVSYVTLHAKTGHVRTW